MKFEKRGLGILRRTSTVIDVELPSAKCIVFLLIGAFKVGEDDKKEAGMGYLIHDEKTIQLQGGTVVAMMNQ